MGKQGSRAKKKMSTYLALAAIVTDLFLVLYVSYLDRPPVSAKKNSRPAGGLSRDKRLIFAASNALVVTLALYWAAKSPSISIEMHRALYFTLPCILGFWLAFQAPTWQNAIGRAVLSTELCVLVVLLFDRLRSPRLEAEDLLVSLLIVTIFGVVSILAASVAYVARRFVPV